MRIGLELEAICSVCATGSSRRPRRTYSQIARNALIATDGRPIRLGGPVTLAPLIASLGARGLSYAARERHNQKHLDFNFVDTTGRRMSETKIIFVNRRGG